VINTDKNKKIQSGMYFVLCAFQNNFFYYKREKKQK
jgi:hypothetical protein